MMGNDPTERINPVVPAGDRRVKDGSAPQPDLSPNVINEIFGVQDRSLKSGDQATANVQTELKGATGSFKCETDSKGQVNSVEWKTRTGAAHTFTRQPGGSWQMDGKPTAIKDMALKNGDLVTTLQNGNQHIDKRDGTTVDKQQDKNRVQKPDGSEQVTYKNGSGYHRVPDGKGGYSETHTGSRPDDAFIVSKTGDGRFTIREKTNDKPYQPLDDPAVVKERERLTKLAESRITDPQELAKFRTDMARFEDRSHKMADMYEKNGLPHDQALKKANDQVAKTYEQESKLLEAQDNPNLPVTAKQRAQLAEQVMRQAASPTLIDQGNHETCNVTVIEVRTYTKNPAEAARMVTDVATTGSYTNGNYTVDHSKFDLDKSSFRPDPEAAENSTRDGRRSFASQLFQVTAVNMAYVMDGSSTRYIQEQPVVSVPPDTGERQLDCGGCPPGTPKKSADWIDHCPGLSDEQQAKAGSQIMGEAGHEWFIHYKGRESPALDHKTLTHKFGEVGSEEELRHRLADAKLHGQLPVTVNVHTGNDPFWRDSDQGDAGGSGGGSGGFHVVNVTDYVDGHPPKVSIDNQWGSQKDRTGDRQISVHDLFFSMREATDKQQVLELQKEVLDDRQHNKVDHGKELELMRRKHDAGWLKDPAYTQAVDQEINTITREWVANGKADPAIQEKVLHTISTLPPEHQIGNLERLFDINKAHPGLLDQKQLDDGLAQTAAVEMVKKEVYTEAGKFPGKTEHEYYAYMGRYNRLVSGLPEDEQKAVKGEADAKLTEFNTWWGALSQDQKKKVFEDLQD